jgi:hypothetical protein
MHRSVLIAAICVDLEQGGVGRADLPFGARYGLNSDIELSPKSAKAPFWLAARYFRSTPISRHSWLGRHVSNVPQPDIVRDDYSESAVAIRQRGQAMTGLFSPGP